MKIFSEIALCRLQLEIETGIRDSGVISADSFGAVGAFVWGMFLCGDQT